MPLTQRQKEAARRRLARKRGVSPSSIGDSEIIAAVSTQEITLTQITQDCAGSAPYGGGDTGASPGGSSGGEC